MIDQQFIDDYRAINDKLLEWDWFVSPYYSGLEIGQLKALASRLGAPHSKEEKERIGNTIADLIVKGNFNFHFRAIVVYEGFRVTPNVRKFSHLFEAGLLELYRFNFIACLGIWIPIVEGVLRSFLGVTFSRNITWHDLTNLRAKDPSEQSFLDVIVDGILRFFSRTFYKSVDSPADLGPKYLNRHFFSHSISHEPLYCRDNCLKLLNVFDAFLAIDFIVDSYFKAISDNTDEKVKLRESYYEQVMAEGLADIELFRPHLLEDHPRFDKEFYYGRRS